MDPRLSIARALVLFALATVASTAAVPTAEAQRLAFTGKDANAPDEFAFVAVDDIANGTQIYFTNYDWDNTTGTFPNLGTEGVVLFTATALIPRGTVVLVQETAADVFTVTGNGTATIAVGSWSAVSADPHYGFKASSPGSPLDSVTQIYAYMDTDPDVAVGGIKDPRIGMNPSPGAIVVDFSVTQPVGTDFSGNRATAIVSDLTSQANFLEGGSITLDLTPFGSVPVQLERFSAE